VARSNGKHELAEAIASCESILLEAAAIGDMPKAEKALEAGANVNCRDRAKRKPVHAAALYGHVQMLGLLIKHGADVDTFDKVIAKNGL